MRDLIRTRKQAVDALKVAKQHLQSFLLRHGLSYRNGIYWTKRHRRWLAELRRFPYPHQQLAFEELKRAIDQIEVRVATLDKTIEKVVVRWRFAPVVDALRLARREHHDRGNGGGRDRRHFSLRQPPPADGLAGPGPE